MSTRPILSAHAVAGWWGRTPTLASSGLSNGVSAALWDARFDSPTERSLPADPATHLLSIHTRNFLVDAWQDGKLAHRGYVPSGSINIIRAGVAPRAVMYDGASALHVYLPRPFLDGLAAQSGIAGAKPVELINPNMSRDPTLQAIAAQMIATMRQGDTLGRLAFDGFSQAVGAHLLRRWSNFRDHAAAQRPTVRGGLAAGPLRLVQEYLRTHLDEDIGLAELARLARLSPHHFCRAFKQSTGLPPHAWLAEQRMRRAMQLMTKDRTLGLTQIALSVGYGSQTSFGIAFKRATGLTPSQWRRSQSV
jgi:AraC family transcriptional regulator